MTEKAVFNLKLANVLLEEGFGKDLLRAELNYLNKSKIVFIFKYSDELNTAIEEYVRKYKEGR
jgi:hypothetical protein